MTDIGWKLWKYHGVGGGQSVFEHVCHHVQYVFVKLWKSQHFMLKIGKRSAHSNKKERLLRRRISETIGDISKMGNCSFQRWTHRKVLKFPQQVVRSYLWSDYGRREDSTWVWSPQCWTMRCISSWTSSTQRRLGSCNLRICLFTSNSKLTSGTNIAGRGP